VLTGDKTSQVGKTNSQTVAIVCQPNSRKNDTINGKPNCATECRDVTESVITERRPTRDEQTFSEIENDDAANIYKQSTGVYILQH
jgi:hypothetical protein